MESSPIKVHINSKTFYKISPLPSKIYTLRINLFQKTRRFFKNKSDGTLTFTGSHTMPHVFVPQINLELISSELKPNYLSPVINSYLNDMSLSHLIANTIADKAIQHDGFTQPYFMSVSVVLSQDLFFPILDSHLRKQEEEDMKSSCAICLEDFRKRDDDDNEGTMILPCSHQFHAGCIGEWLHGKNSCPLCREIVF